MPIILDTKASIALVSNLRRLIQSRYIKNTHQAYMELSELSREFYMASQDVEERMKPLREYLDKKNAALSELPTKEYVNKIMDMPNVGDGTKEHPYQ